MAVGDEHDCRAHGLHTAPWPPRITPSEPRSTQAKTRRGKRRTAPQARHLSLLLRQRIVPPHSQCNAAKAGPQSLFESQGSPGRPEASRRKKQDARRAAAQAAGR
ncbi:hypothetical protein ACCO45_001950 [Purpureocillium lilacinum]|uniref:Uncharacterized protein n=1 Tax=Purpureocillium lilacinum TaxID=33203 RepID=A0ACC4EB50_PURLI